MRQVIIIGSGPAGYTAAIYAARANLEPLLIASSVEFGGELMKTTDVENFPGFPEGIMGPDLMTRMQQQAERFGTEIVYDDVTELELGGDLGLAEGGSGGAPALDDLLAQAMGHAFVQWVEARSAGQCVGHGISLPGLSSPRGSNVAAAAR